MAPEIEDRLKSTGSFLQIDGSGERRPEPRHGRVSRGVTPDDFGTLETHTHTQKARLPTVEPALYVIRISGVR